LLSVAVVMMGSVDAFQKKFSNALSVLEWAFTSLFTLEYGLRLISVRRPWLYFKSFFGLVGFAVDFAHLPGSSDSRYPVYAGYPDFEVIKNFLYPQIIGIH